MNIYVLLGMIPYAALFQPVFYYFNSKRTRKGASIAGKIIKFQGFLVFAQAALGVIGFIKWLN